MSRNPAVRNVVLALLALSLGCDPDTATEPQTVRLSVIADAEHGGAPFHTPMTQELTTVPVFAGDPDGVGTALITVNRGQGEICWELTAANIALPATASHIHRAPAGVRGGIVVFLSAPDAAGNASGCAGGLDPDLLREILESPAAFYVNVHTTDFPAGAIRGQLGR